MTPVSHETIKVLQSQCSTRKFLPTVVEEAILQEILRTAVKAPNASNRQNYSMIIVRDTDLLCKFFYNAPIGLLFCVDYTRIIETAAYMGHSYEVYDLFNFVSGVMDTMLVAQTAVIAAQAHGLGTLFTNSLHRTSLEEVYSTFNLPSEYCFPLLSLCLGFAAEQPTNLRGRYFGPGLIHNDTYHHLTQTELDHLIQEYDDPEKGIGLAIDHGLDHFLDWFYTKWSAQRYNESKIQEFYRILKRVKFIQDQKPL